MVWSTGLGSDSGEAREGTVGIPRTVNDPT